MYRYTGEGVVLCGKSWQQRWYPSLRFIFRRLGAAQAGLVFFFTVSPVILRHSQGRESWQMFALRFRAFVFVGCEPLGGRVLLSLCSASLLQSAGACPQVQSCVWPLGASHAVMRNPRLQNLEELCVMCSKSQELKDSKYLQYFTASVPYPHPSSEGTQ